MSDLHRHRCGYDPYPLDGKRSRGGCGLVFEHDPDAGRVTHICERCGTVTTWRYSGPLLPGEGVCPPKPEPVAKPRRARRRPTPDPVQLKLFEGS